LSRHVHVLGIKPGRITRASTFALPYPRDLTVAEDPEFVRLVVQLRTCCVQPSAASHQPEARHERAPIADLSRSRPFSGWSAATGSWLQQSFCCLVTIVLWEAAVRIFAISASSFPPHPDREIARSAMDTLMQATLVTAE